MSLQIGYFNPDGSQNTTSSPAGNNVPNLVQMVVLNYMALHGTSAIANWPTLWPAPNVNNTLGSGTALEPLIAFQPLAGLVERKGPGLIEFWSDRKVGPSSSRFAVSRETMRCAARVLRSPDQFP